MFAPFLGFYWDDFPYMWFTHTNGPWGAIQAIALDRPVLGLFYGLPLAVLGESPLPWQLFAILCRWLFSLSVYFFLDSLFPDQKSTNKLIILLFTVFPGFTQQYISVIYSHAFLIFGLYFFSLQLFVHAVKSHRLFPLGWISILFALICMAATEYLVGLEVLRPFIIYLIIHREQLESSIRKKIQASMRRWLPYLLAGAGFVFYRIYLASSVLYKVSQTENFARSPLVTLLNLALVTLQNTFTALITAWQQMFLPFTKLEFHSLTAIVYLAVFLFTFFISAAWIFGFLKKKPDYIQREYKNSLLLGGSLVLVFAGIPFWAANFKLDVNFPADRFFLPFMLASSTIIFLFISLLWKKKFLFSVFFGLIFSLSLASHVYQANVYRNEWDRFKDFISQVSWRMPSLEDNTLLVTDQLTLQYYSDNSLTAAFNWVYADPNQAKSLPYLINYTDARLGRSLPSLSPNTPVIHNFRTHQFNGSTDRMILFYHLPPGCFHIADPDLDPFNPLIDASIRSSTVLSKPELIGGQIQQNQVFFVSSDASASWCYYFQKAALAAQNKDWSKVVELGQTAFSLNDYPNDASERIPFIEGFAMTADWQRALGLTKETYQVSKLYQPILCRLWQRIEANTTDSDEKSKTLEEMNLLLDCDQ
jgi:hypothetical protein